METKTQCPLIPVMVSLLLLILGAEGANQNYQTYNGPGPGYTAPSRDTYGYNKRGYSHVPYGNYGGSSYAGYGAKPTYKQTAVSSIREYRPNSDPYSSKTDDHSAYPYGLPRTQVTYRPSRYGHDSAGRTGRYGHNSPSTPYGTNQYGTRTGYGARYGSNGGYTGNKKYPKDAVVTGGGYSSGSYDSVDSKHGTYDPVDSKHGTYDPVDSKHSSSYNGNPWGNLGGVGRTKYASNPYIEDSFVKSGYSSGSKSPSGFGPRTRIYGKSAKGLPGAYEDIDLIVDKPTKDSTYYYGQVAPLNTLHYKRGQKTYSRKHDPCVELSQGNYALDAQFQKLFPYVDKQCYFVKCANKKAYLNPCSRATRNDKDGRGFCSHLDLEGYCGYSIHDTDTTGYGDTGSLSREK